MIRLIAWKTLLEWWRDQRLPWLAAGTVIILVATALFGLQSATSIAQDRTAAVTKETANFLDQGAKNPHAAAHFGQYAFRPLLITAAVDPGVSPWMGSMIWMEAHRRNLPEFRAAEDGAGYRQTNNLSVAWILQTVVPLIIILLGFASIAGEREQGTLRLMLAQGATLNKVVLAKTIALLLVTVGLMLPLALIVIFGSSTETIFLENPHSPTRLGWLAIGYALYILGFIGIVMICSLVARSALTALGALLMLWMTLVILIPRVSTDIAAMQYPLPSAAEFWEGIKRGEGLDQTSSPVPTERAARLREQVRTELLQRYDVTRIEDLPLNFTAVYLQRLEEHDVPIFDHAYSGLWQQQENQRRLRTLGGLLSPTVSLREVSMALAGTDPFAMKHFSDAAEQHRRQLVRTLNEKQARDGAGKAFYVAPAETWQEIPMFSYTPPSISDVLARHERDLLWLLIWAWVPFALIFTLTARSRKWQ